MRRIGGVAIPEVGWAYADRDTDSAYRVVVVQVDRDLAERGKRGIQLQNRATGRRHWTTLRRLYTAYRRVA